ncbi:MAG TPA: hypothetical protein VM327_03335 [Candidatus Thermoplasmatota archaeon]|nr:hypothetical protein [Candidatus Thermoplasmatota archaeon]
MTDELQIHLDSNAHRALMKLSSAAETPPRQLLDDAIVCLVAARGLEDYVAGTPRPLTPARMRKDQVTWSNLENSTRAIDALQGRLDQARDLLRRARLAKSRYHGHQDLWSRLLLGLSVPTSTLQDLD